MLSKARAAWPLLRRKRRADARSWLGTGLGFTRNTSASVPAVTEAHAGPDKNVPYAEVDGHHDVMLLDARRFAEALLKLG
jgi:hypothetical protein